MRKFKSDEIDDWLCYQDWVSSQRKKEDKLIFKGRADHLHQWIKLQAIKFAERQKEDANALQRTLQLLDEAKYGEVNPRISTQVDMEDEADSSMHETQFIQSVLNAPKKGSLGTVAKENNSQMLCAKKPIKKVQIKDEPIENAIPNLRQQNRDRPKVVQGIMKRKTAHEDSIMVDNERKETWKISSPQSEGASSYKKPTNADYRALIESSQIGDPPNKTSWWKKLFKLRAIGSKNKRDSSGYQEVITLFISLLNRSQEINI